MEKTPGNMDFTSKHMETWGYTLWQSNVSMEHVSIDDFAMARPLCTGDFNCHVRLPQASGDIMGI